MGAHIGHMLLRLADAQIHHGEPKGLILSSGHAQRVGLRASKSWKNAVNRNHAWWVVDNNREKKKTSVVAG